MPQATRIKSVRRDTQQPRRLLEAAREELGHLESRISSIESTLKYAVVIDPNSPHPAKKVRLGARVSVKDLNTGRETSYTLVDRFEAQLSQGKISDVSPLGKALVNRLTGQEIEVDTPRGKTRYRILKVTS